jgi:hypothetical protein
LDKFTLFKKEKGYLLHNIETKEKRNILISSWIKYNSKKKAIGATNKPVLIA